MKFKNTLGVMDAKLESYRLITDPSRLFVLLFSKYGYMQEEFYIFLTNQLMFNKLSHFNVLFKEQNTFFDITENIQQFYHKYESHSKIIKLNKFYKNYQSFFCKATLADIALCNLLKNYQDAKAEIFYKNNYGDKTINKESQNKNKKYYNSSSIPSFDSITYNQTIFDTKNKIIIENEGNKSLTLNSESFSKNKNWDYELDKMNMFILNSSCSNNENNNSLVKCIGNLLFYSKKKEENSKNIEINKIRIVELNNRNSLINKRNKNKVPSKKTNFDNINKKYKQNLSNLLQSPSNNNKDKFKTFKDKSFKDNKTKVNDSKTNNNILLSPRQRKLNFSNLTSRLTEFKKFKAVSIKNTKRNKSFNIISNKKNNQMITDNKCQYSNNSNSFPYNKKLIELTINNIKKRTITQLKNNSAISLHINKSSRSQISKYSTLLVGNSYFNKKNQSNIINKRNKLKNLSNKNIIFNQSKKLIKSSSQNGKSNMINNKGFYSKFSLFKNGNISPANINPVKNHNNKRHLNILQTYNQFINKTKNYEEDKKFIISTNSIDNNKHRSSLSPKSISKNLEISRVKKLNIINNINVINKINLPKVHNKTSNNKNNESNNHNYNINFNNLFFYNPNIAINYFDNFKNSIINNQNQNMNINKINTNFYMLSFNGLNNSNSNNSRNKIKMNNFNHNSSSNKIKINTYNNTNMKNFRKSESQKKHMTYKKRRLNLNGNKMSFTINKVISDKRNNL